MNSLKIKFVKFNTFVPATHEEVRVRAFKRVGKGLQQSYEAIIDDFHGKEIRIRVIPDGPAYFGTLAVNGKLHSFTETDHRTAEKAFAAVMRNRLRVPFKEFLKNDPKVKKGQH
jgi:hypothetical protein